MLRVVMTFRNPSQDQLAFMNPFHATELAGEFFQPASLAPQNEDFQAKLVRQMHVED